MEGLRRLRRSLRGQLEAFCVVLVVTLRLVITRLEVVVVPIRMRINIGCLFISIFEGIQQTSCKVEVNKKHHLDRKREEKA